MTSTAGICCLTLAEAGKSKVKVSVGLVCSSNQEGRICSRPLSLAWGGEGRGFLPCLHVVFPLSVQMCTYTFPLLVRTAITSDERPPYRPHFNLCICPTEELAGCIWGAVPVTGCVSWAVMRDRRRKIDCTCLEHQAEELGFLF